MRRPTAAAVCGMTLVAGGSAIMLDWWTRIPF